MVTSSDLLVERALENEVHLFLWLLQVAYLVDPTWSGNMVTNLHLEFVRDNLELAQRHPK